MIFQAIKMAIKSIFSNKMRSFLTVLGIVIGVVAIVVLVAIAQGASHSIVSGIEGMGTNLLSVNIRAKRGSVALTQSKLSELYEVENIAELAPLNRGSGTAKAGETSYTEGSIQGTVPSYASIRNYSLLYGRFLQQPDLDNRSFVAVLGRDAAKALFATTACVGESFSLNGYTIRVIGVLNQIGSSVAGSGDNQIILPFSLVERIFNQKGIESFFVSAASSAAVSEVEEALRAFLEKVFPASLQGSRSTQTPYTIYNQTEMLTALNESMATLSLMLGGIAGISLLVGGVGIMNIMLVSVSEQTREIGIRKAIGASRNSIMMQFLVEALAVSLLGAVLGLLFSAAACLLLSPVLKMTLSISPLVSAIAVGCSMLIGIVFGIFPANKASKLKPIEALRYEG